MIDHYIRQYGRRLYGLCLKLCANSFEADDLYQDTWLRVLKSIQQYDSEQPFEPWLTKICVNTYRNALRRIARSPFLQFQTEEEQRKVFEQTATPEPADYSDLHGAIDKLPDKLRITLILFYFQDMSTVTVAQTLGIPEGTVKSRLSKARQRLKEVLGHETNL